MTSLDQLLTDAGWNCAQLSNPDRQAIAPADQRFDQCLVGHQAQLRRLLHRLLGFGASASELDDVLQEVLLSAWQHRARFRGDSALSTWLSAIALRKAHNHMRWSRRFWRRFTSQRDEPIASAPVGEDARLQPVRIALAGLRHQDREVLVLRYLEQRPIELIAELLGLQRNTVDARLSRARKALRAALPAELVEALP